ncbi:MAG: hypothetical protein NVSMB63_20300 [Sediminibacterium sp.]
MKQNKKNCDLHSCVLCRQCLKDWLPAIDASRKSFHFKKGELLFKEDEEVTGMYFINTGLVKVHKKWGSDKELILRLAKNGEIVGHRGLGSDIIYPVSATALEQTDVCFIAHMTVKGRIANALLFLKQKFGITAEGNLAIGLSRQDIASYTGTTYETLFRMMNELIDENIIKIDGKNIFLLQEDKLQAYTKD